MHTEIKPSQISQTDYQRTSHTVIAKPGQSLEDIMKPSSWASVAPKIRAWDQVVVIAEDGSYVAELFVVAVSRQWVRLAVMKHLDLTQEDAAETPDELETHLVKWRGPVMKWCVVRVADDSNIAEKLESKEDAGKAKIEYEKALGL